MSGRDRRRGIVLVTVLWSIALLSALAMAASVSFRQFAGIAAISRDRVQSEALLTAGVEVAVDIAANAAERPLNGVETVVTLSTGTVRARLADEGGRIDIGKAPVEVLASLLRAVGAPDQQADGLARAIVEWRKRPVPGDGSNNPGNNPSNSPGNDTVGANIANSGGSGNTTPPAPDHPFADVFELARIPGIAPAWIAAMQPLTTVYGSETVNPLTAPAEVIAALPDVDGNQLAAFLAVRRQSPTDAERISATLAAAQRYLAAKRQQVVGVELAAALPDGYAAAARAVVVVLPQDRQPYHVLVWKPLAPTTL
jgi:general secretion pathway protein K